MSLGIDYNLYAQAYADNAMTKLNKYASSTTASNNPTTTASDTSIYQTGSGNTCTDGVDDGKIGLSFLPYIIKGAGKSVVNTVKGIFLDENGNLSLGKTLFALGTGVACTICSPLAFAFCGLGVVTGATKFISGFSNAVNAKTDAEAKDMWEQVGEGGLTLGLSLWGAKASLNSIQSSAAAASQSGQSALQALETQASQNGVKATLMQQIKAFGQDCIASTKNNLSNAVNFVKTTYRNLKADKYASETWKAYNNPKYQYDESGNLTEASEALKQKAVEKITLKRAKADEAYAKKGIDFHQLTEDAHDYKIAPMKNAFQEGQNNIIKASEQLAQARQSGDTEAINLAREALSSARKAQLENTPFGELTASARTLAQNAINGLKNMSKESVKEFGKTLFTNPKELAIYQALTAPNASYNQIVSQYGYENVIGVIKIILQEQQLNQTV